MYARPAGMSDDDDDDALNHDDELRYSKKNTEWQKQCLQKSSTCKGTDTFDRYRDEFDEKQTTEDSVITACKKGYLQYIEEYLTSHNVNDFLNTGWTPLLYAGSFAQAEVIKVLLKNGADPNIHRDGYTPLMALCQCTIRPTEECLKCLKLLVEVKANVNAANKRRETPLMYACKSQGTEFVAELIKHVKNVNAYDSEKRTALFYAVIANKPDVVQILLENSADVTLTDRRDLTAKDVADLKGYTEIISLLNTDEDEDTPVCDMHKTYDWKMMFPMLADKDNNALDYDVSTILYGMGLEKYHNAFQGLDVTTFLQLTDDDLSDLGVDISAHRVQYTQQLHRFHTKKWTVHSVGVINKSKPYTIYDCVVSLGNVSKQIAVVNASFRYIKKGLNNGTNEKICLSSNEKLKYDQELKDLRKTLCSLKKELLQMQNLAKKIKKESNIGMPATYIAPKRNKTNWPVILGITLIIGMCLTKTTYIQKLWNS